MGRTTPSVRMVVDYEIKRLEKMMEYIHDPEIRKVMNEIIASYKELAPVFKAVPPYDYPYAILLSGLIKALKRIDEIEQMVEHKS